jgi:pyruvate kinase
MDRIRRTKIVATLGPATDGHELALVQAGLDVARLNFSHGAAAEHAGRAGAIRAAARATGRSVALMLDLQGPKIRIGPLVGGGPVSLEPGAAVAITCSPIAGNATRLGCTYPHLARDVRAGDTVLLDDGRLRLRVEQSDGTEVAARVELGGLLGEHKGINLPGVAVSSPALTEKDRADLRFGVTELEVDYVALSFVRTAADVRLTQEAMTELGRSVPIVVKFEKPEAIDQLDEILGLADGAMVARGDLGVEVAPEQVPMLQKRIIQHANRLGRPVITATQMLESMITAETPTRAEATDVANAVWDGSDAVMLSGETAVGLRPVAAVEMMQRIVLAAEAAADVPDRPRGAVAVAHPEPAAALAHAARVLAADLGATAIVGITQTGLTAELLSREHGRIAVIAFSPEPAVCRRLALWGGVRPVHLDPISADLQENVDAMERYLLEHCGALPSETVVIAGAHPFVPGVRTNFVKFHVLGSSPQSAHSATGS